MGKELEIQVLEFRSINKAKGTALVKTDRPLTFGDIYIGVTTINDSSWLSNDSWLCNKLVGDEYEIMALRLDEQRMSKSLLSIREVANKHAD